MRKIVLGSVLSLGVAACACACAFASGDGATIHFLKNHLIQAPIAFEVHLSNTYGGTGSDYVHPGDLNGITSNYVAEFLGLDTHTEIYQGKSTANYYPNESCKAQMLKYLGKGKLEEGANYYLYVSSIDAYSAPNYKTFSCEFYKG